MSESQNPPLRKKSRENLEKQTKDVSDKLGEEILPPSKEEDVFSMDIEEIRKKYGARYRAYLQMLRPQNEANSEKSARIIKALNNLDRYISKHKSHQEKTTLYERQLSVFEDLHTFFEEGETEGYIKLPTGAGKTVIFSEFIEATGLKTLIVVPTKILVGQTEEKLAEFAEGLDVGKIYTDAKEYGRQVTITTYDSFVSNVENGKIKQEDYDLLILDEAHKSLSEKRITAVRAFKDIIKIGFTATPRYTDDKQVSNLLNSEVHSMGTREAVEEGMLCPCSVIIAETEIDTSNVKVASNGDYSEAELARAINNESRNRAALELYQQAFNGEAAVAYCCGVDHAENLSQLFNSAGVPAAVISGRQSSSEQNDITKKYANGEIQVLCNADILIEGFDEPRASVCLNLRPTLSPVVAEQRAGRVLRIDETHHSKFAKIVDFVDRNYNGKHAPITFAEIIDGARIDGISRTATAQREKNPSYHPTIVINGLKVTTDPQEVMRIVKNIEDNKYQTAPEGWMTVSQMTELTGKDERQINRIADRYRQEHAEWFEKYFIRSGSLRQHLAPELVSLIQAELSLKKAPPEGWLNATRAARQIGAGFHVLKMMVLKYKEEHPEWVGLFQSVRKDLVEFYAPELIEILKQEMQHKEKAPEGWTTSSSLSRKIGRAHATVHDAAEKYRLEHPEWFQDYYLDSGNKYEHFAPELVEKIVEDLIRVDSTASKTEETIEEIREKQKPPQGWRTVSSLRKELHKADETVAAAAEEYRAEHPEWFQKYRIVGLMTQHYSPKLVEKLQQTFSVLEKAPEGWETASSFQEKRGKQNFYKIKEIAQQYRVVHSEWFNKYLTSTGQLEEYMAPELLKIVDGELAKLVIPEGWKSSTGLVEETGSAQQTIQQIAEKYRADHPEWFIDQKYKKFTRTFYHPDLVQLLITEFRKFEAAPEGWRTANEIMIKTGKKNFYRIRDIAEKYRAGHPEWFKKFKPIRGSATEYYSSELSKLVLEEYIK